MLPFLLRIFAAALPPLRLHYGRGGANYSLTLGGAFAPDLFQKQLRFGDLNFLIECVDTYQMLNVLDGCAV